MMFNAGLSLSLRSIRASTAITTEAGHAPMQACLTEQARCPWGLLCDACIGISGRESLHAGAQTLNTPLKTVAAQ